MSEAWQNRLWALACALAALAFAAAPWFSGGFGGYASAQFPVLVNDPPVVPAGYAFSIWGLIYIWLIAGTGFGLLRRASDSDWAAMRPPLFASLVLGIGWIALARIWPVGATLLIWAMLGFALLALFRVGDTDRWWQQTPVAIYAGWLSAASCVSTGVVLGGHGWLPPSPAALLALSLALAITLVVQYRLHRAPEYGLTVVWALIAVIIANSHPFNAAVSGLSILGIIAILGLRATDTE